MDFDGAYGTQCVDVSNYYLRDVFGISNPIKAFPVSYAYQMFDYNAPAGFTKISGNSSFQVGDLVIWNKGRWSGDNSGHVGIVYSVSGSSVTIFDQSPGGKTTTHAINYTSYIRGVFRPALTTPPTVYADDIGTDFYATISLDAFPNSYISIDSSLSSSSDDKHVFFFTRNSNGTYAIRSKYDNRLLDVANFGNSEGTKVQFIAATTPNTAQQWRIQKVGEQYILAPECTPQLVLDLNPYINELRLWSPNGSWVGKSDGKCQLYNINKLEVSTDDIGTDFYATLSLETFPNSYVSIDSSFTSENDEKHILHFTRNSNGTYAIRRVCRKTQISVR